MLPICHWERASVAENERKGGKSHRKRKEPHQLRKVHDHWNQLHKTISGQQMLPRATAPMGNVMRPEANIL